MGKINRLGPPRIIATWVVKPDFKLGQSWTAEGPFSVRGVGGSSRQSHIYPVRAK
jgi:hypothetical protein